MSDKDSSNGSHPHPRASHPARSSGPVRQRDRGGRIRVSLPARQRTASSATRASTAELPSSTSSSSRSTPLKRRRIEELTQEDDGASPGGILVTEQENHSSERTATHRANRARQQKSPKSYLEKLSTLDKGWEEKLPKLADMYARCHTGDGPQFTANKPAADPCLCGTTKRHKAILCAFMAGIVTLI
ncbi:hypothetical protein BJV82DRAFT_582173 [Fennellomyces sp. T-0311]|nr:hypothetical protein BJV82DRAFT_582173 [Fennellomyces sp. T-0311]